MSIKIYNGFEIKHNGKNFVDLFNQIKFNLRYLEKNEIRYTYLIAFLNQFLDMYIEMEINNKLPKPFYIEENVNKIEYLYFVLNQCTMLNKLNVCSSNIQENSKFEYMLDTFILQDCVEDTIVLFPYDDKTTYMVINNSMINDKYKFKNNKGFIETFVDLLNNEGFYTNDFHYQNLISKPEEISEFEWAKRFNVWRNLIYKDSETFNTAGLKIKTNFQTITSILISENDKVVIDTFFNDKSIIKEYISYKINQKIENKLFTDTFLNIYNTNTKIQEFINTLTEKLDKKCFYEYKFKF